MMMSELTPTQKLIEIEANKDPVDTELLNALLHLFDVEQQVAELDLQTVESMKTPAFYDLVNILVEAYKEGGIEERTVWMNTIVSNTRAAYSNKHGLEHADDPEIQRQLKLLVTALTEESAAAVNKHYAKQLN